MPTLADALRGYKPPTNSPMTSVVTDYVSSIPQNFNQNQAKQMELLNQAFPGNTYESMMTQGDPAAMSELAMQVPVVGMLNSANRKDVLTNIFDKVTGLFGKGQKVPQMPEGVVFEKLHPNVQKKVISGDIPVEDAQWMSDFAFTPGDPRVETGTGAWKDQSEKMQNFAERMRKGEISTPKHFQGQD